MDRKQLMALVRDISKVIFVDDIAAEEKIIRVKMLVIDALTEAESVPTFESDNPRR